MTGYDRAHFTRYMQLLSAAAENVSEAEMAYSILGIDPLKEPNRARLVVRGYLKRVNWLLETGYKELFFNTLA
ncbi:hypothetical protein [Roseibium sp.]|uniref:hypothetical protein n=1 Tax=Roseibium sp. TaxID=1936156 RepID=UPI00345C2034